MIRKVSIITCSILLLLNASLHAQYREVRRGERPPIDLRAVPADAYETGVIRIKLHEDLDQWMDNNGFIAGKDGIVEFGIAPLDALHQTFRVKEARQTFNSRALKNQYTDRHRKWGFHLWYDLYVDHGTDIISMVQAYSALAEVAVAEPHYRKELIGEIHLGLEPPRYDDNWQLIDDVGQAGNGNALQPGEQRLVRDEADPIFPNDPLFGNQWHFHNTGQHDGTPGADISLPEAWPVNTGASEVIVAVIDGGIRLDHEDIQGSIWDGVGYNFYLDTTLILGTHHGTHVGGTIGARSNNNVGVSGVASGWGEETGVKLMSLQVFLDIGGQGFELAPIFAADNGAAISQNSWGYSVPNFYEQAVLDAIDYFNVNGGGAVMDGGITITSAGNSNSSSNFYPGYYSGTMSVAATNNMDKRAAYSNYAQWVDISAPGGEVSPVLQRGVYSLTTTGYAYASGTSMAAPHVSGVAALMLSIAPNELSPQQLKNLLKQSADNIDDQNPDYIGQMGTGRLNAYQALLLAAESILSVHNFNVVTQNNHRALLSWTPNDKDHTVLLAWNREDVFGEPEWDMQAGDAIEGGGTILYRGNAHGFSHTMPAEFDKHYYRVWSVDEDEESLSRSRRVMAERDPGTKYIPMQEVFEYNLWPAGWDTNVINMGDGQGHDPVISLSESGITPAATPSAASRMVAFNSFQARNNASARLASIPISTKGLSAVQLELDWHSHASLPNVNDRMTVQLSRNKETWTTVGVLSRHGEETGWTSVQYNLSSHFLDRDTIYLGFLFQSARTGNATGGNMYLDNVRMYAGEGLIVPGFSVSGTDALVGERIVVSNTTNGSDIRKLEWHFGEDAWPAVAYGSGPHEVTYLEHGLKSISLAINDTIELTKQDIVTVHQAAHPAPQDVEATLADGAHVVLSWSWQDAGDAATGFNIYRNGNFLESVTDPSVRSHFDANVPEGWLTYLVRAYFDHPHNESPPGVSRRLAINEVEVMIAVEGVGSTLPVPGVLPFLRGDTLEIMAIPAANHDLMHWLVNGDEAFTDNPLAILISDDTHILAVFQDVTGVDDFDVEDGLLIYPNPAAGSFLITAGEDILQLQMVNMRGQVIRTYHPAVGSTELSIDAGSIPTGVYQVLVSTKTGLLSGRVIINPR